MRRKSASSNIRPGTAAFNTVFQLETAQVQQEDQLAVARGSIALNLISAYRALGGGWEIRTEQHQGSPVSKP